MRHNRRLKRLIGSGFDGRPSGFFFVTATAPGADRLPWDTSKCSHGDRVKCSGKLGCRVHEVEAAKWNSHAPQAWSWAMTELRRVLPGVDVQFWKCWETQTRGVLHLHAIVWALGVSEKTMRWAWAQALDHVYDVGRYRFAWGDQRSCDRIGSKLNVDAVMREHGLDEGEAVDVVLADADEQQRRFVRYGAKYCTKGGERASVVNRTTGEVRRDGSGYRTWSASARWGDRMHAIRAEQRAWASAEAAQLACAPGAAGAAGALDPEPDFYAAEMLVRDLLGGVEDATAV
jgi:hypothetical protein